MALPIIAMGAIAAGGALLNYLNSERSRKLVSEQRNRVEELIGKLQSPQFDTSMLTPPELKILETFTPQFAEMVYEADPKLIQLSDRAQMGQKAQDAALARFQNIASGQSPDANLEVIAALDQAAQRSGSQRDAILADMARQGVSPSSSAYGTLQFGAAAQGQKNMFLASLQAALADRARRDEATSQSATLGGNVARFEMDLERLNNDIINQVNQRNTQARRQYLQDQARQKNEANMFNMERRQKYNDQNLNNIYQAQVAARDMKNKQIGADYETELAKLNARSGVSNARVNDIYAAGQDRSNLISGLTNAGLTAAMMYNNSVERQKDRDARNMVTTTTQESMNMPNEVPLTWNQPSSGDLPDYFTEAGPYTSSGPYASPYRPGPYR